MAGLFSSESGLNIDISRWDTSQVTDMSSMFSSAYSFNCDLSQWNTHVLLFTRKLL